MKFDSKIVPFDRSPAYMHQRAMQSRRENHLIDAVGLLRRAVEQSPENREYRLDLAELYAEMGCHRQSNRLLLDMLAEKDAPAECFYGLALNRLHENDESGARHALRQYLHAAPDGEHSEAVRRLNSELDFFNEMQLPRDRRLMRAQRIAEHACERMREENYDGAAALFDRSLELVPEQGDIRALSALNLMLAGAAEAALERCRQALDGEYVSIRTRCLVAQVFHMAGRDADSEAQMRAALGDEPNEMELRVLLYAACELNMHAEAADLARRALFTTPHERQLMHVRATALLKNGANPSQAAALWTRILRIDPEDTVAAYYAEAVKNADFDAEKVPYAYQVPPAEYERRLRAIADQLSGGAEEIAARWRGNADFRLLLKWCTGVNNESFQRAAVTVLAAMEDEEAESTLREYLSRGYVSPGLKMQASAVLNLRGADLRAFLPASDDAAQALLPDAESLLNEFSVGTRQMIRFAADVLEREYGLSALPGLTMLWTQYSCARKVRAGAYSTPEAGAAALTACYLQSDDATVDFARLCREFGCTQRQLKYIYRRMTNVLSVKNGGRHETD